MAKISELTASRANKEASRNILSSRTLPQMSLTLDWSLAVTALCPRIQYSWKAGVMRAVQRLGGDAG